MALLAGAPVWWTTVLFPRPMPPAPPSSMLKVASAISELRSNPYGLPMDDSRLPVWIVAGAVQPETMPQTRPLVWAAGFTGEDGQLRSSGAAAVFTREAPVAM